MEDSHGLHAHARTGASHHLAAPRAAAVSATAANHPRGRRTHTTQPAPAGCALEALSQIRTHFTLKIISNRQRGKVEMQMQLRCATRKTVDARNGNIGKSLRNDESRASNCRIHNRDVSAA
jgi:hypothetical protein